MKRIGLCMVLASFVVLAFPSGAPAAPPDEFWTSCAKDEQPFDLKCNNPRGVAANPDNGRVYVADQANRRVIEFTALGRLFRVWGWDVVLSGPGDDTTPPEDQFEICLPGQGDVCKAAAAAGGEAGRFSPVLGVAVDSAGGVYVTDFANRRVQKFDSDGNFVLMFGGQVNQTKVGEAAPEAEQNRCPVDPADVCKVGVQGGGNGQFGAWGIGDVITVDTAGTESTADDDVYVGDVGRIQRFDSEGAYQDECSIPGETVQSLDVDSSGNLYAIYNGKADVRKVTPPPACEELASPRFQLASPTAVAVDAAGDVFAFGPISCCGGQLLDPIFQFAPNGSLKENFGKGEFNASTGLATNLCAGSEPPGNLYVANFSTTEAFLRAYGTAPLGCFRARTLPADPIEETAATLNGEVNPKGGAVSECFFEYGETEAYGEETPCVDPSAGEIGTGADPVPVQAEIAGLEKGTVYHFRLSATVDGETETGADLTFKTLGPPVISEERTVRATETEAVLRALVNPEGFTTEYRFQYTTLAAFESEGFAGASQTSLVSIGSAGDRDEHVVGATLEGLQPGAAYRWRVIAANSSGSDEGEAKAFTTYRPFAAFADCANQALRGGASAQLPDCRAYEMVSPVDKNGGDIVSTIGLDGGPGGYMQATPEGDKITYTALVAFADQPSSVVNNQYIATRGGVGWENEGINRPIPGTAADTVGIGLTREFLGFSEDLCQAWVVDNQTPPLAPDGQVGIRNLYERDNCAAPAAYEPPEYEALTPLIPAPPQVDVGTPEQYVDNDSLGGASADGGHVVFSAKTPLGEDAAPGFNAQVYDRFEDENHLVSVLPAVLGGGPSGASNLVGSGAGLGNVQGAVAANGSVVYWTHSASVSGVGTVMARTHPEQGKVAGECSSPATACTHLVSSPLGGAFFWAGAKDGSKALYSEGGDLFEFDLGSLSSRKIAGEALGVAGVSEDLSRIYFVSREALAAGATVGEPNLYLEEDEGAAVELVGTLAEGDVGAVEPGATPGITAYNLVAFNAKERSTRANPSGSALLFQSRAELTAYDNRETESGEPAVEVYRFAVGEGLDCISCNPSGARPLGLANMPIPYDHPWIQIRDTNVTAAAWIPTWEQATHASNLLSEGGDRAFFNSIDPLVPHDSNGAGQDVYQWEAAGTGSCTEASPSYFEQNGGCVDLISSGKSTYEAEFWEADADGSDVFFTALSSLVDGDPGSIDLYDARVGGGYPPVDDRPECEGEACQSPPAPPHFDAPSSSVYLGPSNPKPSQGKCPKGKRRVTNKQGKKVCKPKRNKKKRKAKRASHNRRDAR